MCVCMCVFVALPSLMGQMSSIWGLGSGPWSSAYRFSTGETSAPATMPATWVVQVPGAALVAHHEIWVCCWLGTKILGIFNFMVAKFGKSSPVSVMFMVVNLSESGSCPSFSSLSCICLGRWASPRRCCAGSHPMASGSASITWKPSLSHCAA